MKRTKHSLFESIDAIDCDLDNLTKELHLARYRWAASKLSGAFGSKPIIIDAACGRGYGTSILSQIGTVTGIDICRDALDYAGAKYEEESTKFLRADLEIDLGVPSHSIDAVVSFETLEHLKNPNSALTNFYKSLKNGGLMLMSVPNGLNEGRLVTGASTNPYHVQMYTQEEIGKLLEKSGFSGITFFGQAQIFGLMMRYLRRLESGKVHEKGIPIQLKQSPLRKIKRAIFSAKRLCDLLAEPRPQLISTSDVILVEARK